MFVTKKYLSRRTVLRGLGATVALPLLDAMIPARTALAHTAGAPAPKLAFVYFPHGAIMSEWTPAEAGLIINASFVALLMTVPGSSSSADVRRVHG